MMQQVHIQKVAVLCLEYDIKLSSNNRLMTSKRPVNNPPGDADDSVYSVLCTQHEALLSHLYKASLKYDSEGTLLVKHLSSLLQVHLVFFHKHIACIS